MLQSTQRARQKLWDIRRFTTSAETVFIAVGSNLGNRASNIHKALKALKEHVGITRTSFLYESKPMYKTDQPLFLNAALRGFTNLSPHELLSRLKIIESEMGRDEGGIRYGPRPIDLDILAYGGKNISDRTLTIPHPRIHEREFVLQPLHDIQPNLRIGENNVEELLERVERGGISRVTPLRSGRLLKWGHRTLLMGIINATPDSFSDGGKYNTIDSALEQVSSFLKHGFDIIDIGGQSTRPGAVPVTAEEELRRTIPITEKIIKAYPEVIISCDTYYPIVAKQMLEKGAEMVNDVTSGNDAEMFETVLAHNAAFIMMHMRGDSSTMQTMVDYNDLVHDVCTELGTSIEGALTAGIARWSIITDPGIGFAKTGDQSRHLITELPSFKRGVGGYPTVLGASRKSFLGGSDTATRDWLTAGVVACAIGSGGVDVARVHNADVASAVWAADSVSRRCGD